MGRKRKGVAIDGWLAIDKPLHLSSAAIVAKVRRILNAAKVGHGGTLDPLASGILPIALGEATKTVSYVMDGHKTYRWVVRWGEARTTDDCEGEVIETSPNRPSTQQILAAIPRFLGEIDQVPPVFSAIKIDGRRAYDLARNEEDVCLQPRRVRIDRFELISQPDADHAEFEIATGKGVYVRSLARDLAKALGTCGHVAVLRRIACGPFDENNAISLDKLEQLGHSDPHMRFLLPVATVLDDIPALALTEVEAGRLANGQALSVKDACDRMPPHLAPDSVLRAMYCGQVVALARIEAGAIRPVRVFNLHSTGESDVDYARA